MRDTTADFEIELGPNERLMLPLYIWITDYTYALISFAVGTNLEPKTETRPDPDNPDETIEVETSPHSLKRILAFDKHGRTSTADPYNAEDYYIVTNTSNIDVSKYYGIFPFSLVASAQGKYYINYDTDTSANLYFTIRLTP